jgi:hypothetical protein
MPDEWQTLLRLTGIVTGQGPAADIAALDDLVAAEAARRQTTIAGSPVEGHDPAEVLASLAPRVGPERLLDLMLRCGPYELTLADLEAAPHGIDLGPLRPRLPDVLRTASGRIELAPEALVADVARLHGELGRGAPTAAGGWSGNGGLVLVGRRDLRSNNSWMHNLPLLASGPPRCTAHVHPIDAERLGLVDGAPARVRSRAGEIELPVQVTEDVMPGVVSIPHGWGHDTPGAMLGVASAQPGANSNVLADELLLEPLSGTAILNGIPVELAPVGSTAAVATARA